MDFLRKENIQENEKKNHNRYFKTRVFEDNKDSNSDIRIFLRKRDIHTSDVVQAFV